MKKIILASASAQRRKLLKMLGLKFNIKPSNAPEIQKIRTNCADLVKENALVKAREVSARIKTGIVIGADSVVYLGDKKIIGKPRDLREAKINLKKLFRQPHWVYTGVAIIDADTGEEMVDYEKTKIYMEKLSDKEIDSYHSKMSPLDKAGGFDIEGKGGVFIKRIEGCYTNVIGLPLAKLSQMLKKFGVSILSVLVVFIISGCSSEYNLATRQHETLLYNTEKEVRIGDSVARQVEAQYKMVTEVDVNERAQRVLKKLVEVSDRRDVVFFIKIIDDDIMNAVSLPGGHIYLFRGLVEKLDSDDEIAGVIAHEMAHITARHAVKRIQAAYGAMIFEIAAVSAGGGGEAALALNTIFTAYSQADELEADRLAVKYSKMAGFDPHAITEVLRKLREHESKEPARQFSYWRTHPYIAQRIAAVNQEITGTLEFRDYLNLTK
jgi:septum formation protein